MLPPPIIFGNTYHWHNLLSIIALIISYAFIILSNFKNKQLDTKTLIILLYCLLIFGLLGSRSSVVLENFFGSTFDFQQYDFLGDYLKGQGRRWYGSLLLIVVVSPLLLIFYTLEKYLKLMDLFAISFCIMITIGKIGCFLDGHWGCYGIPTSLPWGVHFRYGNTPSIPPVHPVQIYDSLFHFILFFILISEKIKRRKTGFIFSAFIFSTCLYNILIEFIRTNDTVLLGLSFAQYCYIMLLNITGMAIFLRHRILKD